LDFHKVLTTRRSVREYTDKPVSAATVRKLLDDAVTAPSSMGTQPWTFAVFQNRDKLKELSKQTKQFLLDQLARMPRLEKYREFFGSPDSDVFYGASTLVLILCPKELPTAEIDGALAASNLMLAARDQGIGSCWMGFVSIYLDQPHARAEWGIPEGQRLVAPLALGYPSGAFSTMDRKPPRVLFWQE